jgi:intron-binding protein aquarius
VTTSHYEKVTQLQRLAFKHIPALRELALANCGAVEKRDSLKRFLAALSEEQLRFLVTQQLRLVAQEDPWAGDAKFLMEVMLAMYERRRWVPVGAGQGGRIWAVSRGVVWQGVFWRAG